jgi:hypothetical protein
LCQAQVAQRGVDEGAELAEMVRAVERDDDASAGAGDPAQFGDRAFPVGHVIQHVVGHRPVREPVGHRQRRRVACQQHGTGDAGVSGGQHPGRHVDTQQPAAVVAASQFRQVDAVAAADVRHCRVRRRLRDVDDARGQVDVRALVVVDRLAGPQVRVGAVLNVP